MNQMAQHTSNLDQLHQLAEEAPSSSKLLSALLSVGVFLLLALVVKLSLWQGSYNLDPHHWGLMLSNAKDLADGKIPYKEIFIQYGILTTLIHAFAYNYLGGNLQSIILISSIAYAVGLYFVYKISQLYLTRWLSLIFVITCILFHPALQYPWSNYVCFPFIMSGIYVLLKEDNTEQNSAAFLKAGILLGLALMSRETLHIAIFLIVMSFASLDFLTKRNSFKNYLIFACGLSLPIGAFIAYLIISNNFQYWFLYFYKLPRIYTSIIFSNVDSHGYLYTLFHTFFVKGLIKLQVRYLLMFFALLICILKLSQAALSNKTQNLIIIKVALASFALLSAAIHNADEFRLATGSILSISVLYYSLRNSVFVYPVSSLIVLLLMSTVTFSSEYQKINKEVIKNSVPIVSPSYFKGQQWPSDMSNYYSEIEHDLYSLKSLSCKLEYHYNSTPDAFLQVISPFKQFQIAPMGDGPKGRAKEIDALRPDLNFNEKIIHPSNMIVFKQFKQTALEKLKQNKGFELYRLYPLPRDLGHKYNKQDDYLGIFIPKHCNV